MVVWLAGRINARMGVRWMSDGRANEIALSRGLRLAA